LVSGRGIARRARQLAGGAIGYFDMNGVEAIIVFGATVWNFSLIKSGGMQVIRRCWYWRLMGDMRCSGCGRERCSDSGFENPLMARNIVPALIDLCLNRRFSSSRMSGEGRYCACSSALCKSDAILWWTDVRPLPS
jgi:hypothetical protein